VLRKWLTKEKCPECGSQMWLSIINASVEKATAKLSCGCGSVFEKDFKTGEIKLLYKVKPSLSSSDRFIKRVLREAKLL